MELFMKFISIFKKVFVASSFLISFNAIASEPKKPDQTAQNNQVPTSSQRTNTTTVYVYDPEEMRLYTVDLPKNSSANTPASSPASQTNAEQKDQAEQNNQQQSAAQNSNANGSLQVPVTAVSNQETKEELEDGISKPLSDPEFFEHFVFVHRVTLDSTYNDSNILYQYLHLLQAKEQLDQDRFLAIYRSNPALYKLKLPSHNLLMFGLYIQSKKIIEYALTLKDEFTYKSPDDGTGVIHFAAHYGNRAILELMLQFNDIETKDERGRTPLFWAIMGNNLECAQYLLERGAHINTCDIDGHTLTHQAACIVDNNEIVKLLLRRAPFTKNKFGHTPTETRQSYFEQEAEKQWEYAHNVYKRLKYGFRDTSADNALYLAVQFNLLNHGMLQHLLDIIEKAINSGAHINLQDDKGNTPLHVAIALKNWQVASLLLKKGADTTIANKAGKTPLQLIEELNKKAQERAKWNNKDSIAEAERMHELFVQVQWVYTHSLFKKVHEATQSKSNPNASNDKDTSTDRKDGM
jgi:ankyrin repeat protein